jgi:hypothetical protein
MTRRIKKFLAYSKIVLPLVLCFVASVFLTISYQAETSNNKDIILRQKQYMLDILAMEAKETALAFNGSSQCATITSSIVKQGIQHLDAQPHTLGAAYGPNLALISERQFERGTPSDQQIYIDPTKDEKFNTQALATSQGVYNYEYKKGTYIKIHYKWVKPACGESTLLVTGITDDLVQTNAGFMTILNTIIILTAMSGYVFIILWSPKRG